MPIYTHNGQEYNIPDDKSAAFEKSFPGASISYMNEGDRYDIPISKRDQFVAQFPSATLFSIDQPAPAQQESVGDMGDTPQFNDEPDLRAVNDRRRQQIERETRKQNAQEGMDMFNADRAAHGVAPVMSMDEMRDKISGSYAQRDAGSVMPAAQPEDDESGVERYWRKLKEGGKRMWGNILYGFGETANAASKRIGGTSAIDKDLASEALSLLESRSAAGQDLYSVDLKTQKEINAMSDEDRKKYEHDLAVQSYLAARGSFAGLENGGADQVRERLKREAEEGTPASSVMEKGAKIAEENTPTEEELQSRTFGEKAIDKAADLSMMIGSGLASVGLAAAGQPELASALGSATFGGFAASSAGESMRQAKEAGATDDQAVAAGLASGAIMYGIGRLPFNRFTKSVTDAAKVTANKEIAEAIASDKTKEEIQKEVASLLGKMYGKKAAAKEIVGHALASGASFGTMGALESVVPLIYQDPQDFATYPGEKYPLLKRIVGNATQSAMDGLIMGVIMGSVSTGAEFNRRNRAWKEQGFVGWTETNIDPENPNVMVWDAKTRQWKSETLRDTNPKVVEIYGAESGEDMSVSGSPAVPVRESGAGWSPDYIVVEMDGKLVKLTRQQINQDRTGIIMLDKIDPREVKREASRARGEEASTPEDQDNIRQESEYAEQKAAIEEQATGLISEETQYELDNARASMDGRRAAVQEDIQSRIGRPFWTREQVLQPQNPGEEPVEPTEDDIVRVITFADGHEEYIVGQDDNGNYVTVSQDGKTSFINQDGIDAGISGGAISDSRTISLSQYLDEKVQEQDSMAEQERIATEEATNLTALVEAVQQEGKINIGTPENIEMADVVGIDPMPEGGVMINAEGGPRLIGWQQVADSMGLPFQPKSTMEEVRDRLAQESADLAPVEQVETPEAVAGPEAQVPAEAQAAQQQAAVFDDEVANNLQISTEYARTDGDGRVVVDTKRLWEKDPALWVKYNDADPNKVMGSQEFLTEKIAGIDKEINKRLEDIKKETLGDMDQDKIDALRKEAFSLQERKQHLSGVLDEYIKAQQQPVVEEPVPAPAPEAIEPAAEATVDEVPEAVVAEQQEVAAEMPEKIQQAEAQDIALSMVGTDRGSAVRRILNEKLTDIRDRLDAAPPEERQALIEEKAAAIREAIDQIKSEDATVTTRANLGSVLLADGVDDATANYIVDRVNSEDENINGFRFNGKSYIIADKIDGALHAIGVYIHERQHGITERMGYGKVLADLVNNDRELLLHYANELSGADYSEFDSVELADEIISYSMQFAYESAPGKFEENIRRYGLDNEKILNFVKSIDDEQRKDPALSLARRHSLRGVDAQGGLGQDGRNSQEISGRGMGVQGDGTDGSGEERAQGAGQPAEPAAGAVEAETPEERIIREEGVSSVEQAARLDAPGIRFNISTEPSVEKKIREFARSKEGKVLGWTDEKVETIIQETADLMRAIHAAVSGDKYYDEWAKRMPTVKVDWRDGVEKPTVTWARANIEYKYDMSADLLCINNEGLESVLASPTMADLMLAINKTATDGFTSDDYLRLYTTLHDLGFVVPCKGCFDAAMRLKMLPSVAQKFVSLVNKTIDERNQNPEAFDADLRAMAGDNPTVGGLPTSAQNKEMAVRIGVAGDNLTEHINWTQLMSAEGQTKALSDWGGIFRAWQRTGAGRPKDKLMPEPWSGDIVSSTTTIIGKYGEKTPSFRDIQVNQGTGLRRNSHSEFRPLLAIDEIQFMREAFLRGLTVFKYMKELDDVRLFGQLGVKFNISFFPAFVPGAPAAGLDANGDYIAAEESVGGREFEYVGEDGKMHYDGMKGWQEAQKYVNKDVSLSSVVFSIPHLIKALTDVPTKSDPAGRWGSLIPFHASGATRRSLSEQGLGEARAIGVGHGFEEALTDYDKGVTNFEAVQNDRFGEGWTIVEGKKAGQAVDPGHKLEFVNGTHYYNEDLGLHLFPTFYIYDSELKPSMTGKGGKIVVSKAKVAGHPFVIDYNDKVREIGTDTAYQDASDFYINQLRQIGLVPRFDFEVPEEIFLKMCSEINVDPNHPKLGWRGPGNSWTPIDSEAYYSLFCDYGMIDPETGKWAPHNPVGMIDENGNRVFRLPENTIDIIKEGVARYGIRKDRETGRMIEAISEFAKRSVAEGRLTQEDADRIIANAKDEMGDPVKPERPVGTVNEAAGIRWSKRTKEPPKKKIKVYKLMRLGEDKKSLRALFIDSSNVLELKNWYDADSPALGDVKGLPSDTYTGTKTVEVKGEKVKVPYKYASYLVDNTSGEITPIADFVKDHKGDKRFSKIKGIPNPDAINWATENGMRWIQIQEKEDAQRRYEGENRAYYNYGINGAGAVSTYAMRPGHHAGSLPSMRQIGKGSGKNLRDDSFVWVEGYIPADVSYQAEADANPDKDIPTHIPVDGYYLKPTNADLVKSQADKIGWYVAGSFYPNRIIGDNEARLIIDKWNSKHPDAQVEYDWPRESGKVFNAKTMQLEDDISGKVIDELFGEKNAGEAVSPKQDSEYMTAIESGDTKKAQKMVREAAEKAGYTLAAYHGTTAEFNQFRFNPDDIGLHFGDKKTARFRVGRGKGAKVMPVYLKMENTLKFNEDLGAWDGPYIAQYLLENNMISQDEAKEIMLTPNGYQRDLREQTRRMRDWLIAKGYDSLEYPNWYEGNEATSYAILRPQNIKSAETVTYGNDGKAIPLSERFKSGSSDIRFSKAPKTKEDKDYLAAIEAGDMEKVQKMVDSAAEKAFKNSKVRGEDGKLLKVYHGTGSDFNVFERPDYIYDNGLGNGFYFTDDPKAAALYTMPGFSDNAAKIDDTMIDILIDEFGVDSDDAVEVVREGYTDIPHYDEAYDRAVQKIFPNPHVVSAYINIERPFVYDENTELDGWEVSEKMDQNNLDGVIEKGYAKRYQSLFDHIEEDKRPSADFGQYMVRRSSQIKSADPITYDDAGNIIPLSERFNEKTPDIRFSKGESKPVIGIAPNGKPSNLNEKQWKQVRTPEFKKWFGDWENDPANASKVVDENGEPRVVYHGTGWNPMAEKPGKAVFSEDHVGENFDSVDIDWNFFFTASEAAAHGYGRAVPVFLNIRNMEIHDIRERVVDNISDELDGHEVLVTAHDAGSEWDSVTKVENPDGVMYTIRAVNTSEADKHFREAIQSWENEHRQEMEDRYNALGQTADEIYGQIEQEMRSLYDQLGFRELFGEDVDYDTMKEMSNYILDETIQSAAKLKNVSTEKLDDLKRQYQLIDTERFNIFHRFGIEGRPEYDQFAHLEKEQLYTRSDIFALDNPNQIKSAEGNNGDFSPENPDIRFSKGRKDERSLVGVHNISGAKLRKAVKAGGLANPSAAVIDIDSQDHMNFGEISLIMPSSLVSASSGRNAGTFLGDAWTPTFPGSKKVMSRSGEKVFREQVDALPSEMSSRVAHAFDEYLEDDRDGDALRWWFLQDTGRNPEIIHHTAPYSEEDARIIRESEGQEIAGENLQVYADLYKKYDPEDFNKKATVRFDPERAKSDFVRRVMEEHNEELDKYGIHLSSVEHFLSVARYDIEKAGRLDEYATMDAARNAVEDNKLQDEFQSWLESKENQFGAETKLFAGWDRNGYKKWVDYTAANASKIMNREPAKNAYGDNGLSATRATLVNRLRTLAEIRANKDKLVSKEEYEKEYDRIESDLASAISELDKMQKITDNPFTNYDYSASRLQEALGAQNPAAYLNREYRYSIPEDGEYAKTLEALKKEIMDMPAKYFETKFNRPVDLSEFAAAVIPSDLDQKTRDILADAGLSVVEYDRNDEGSRRRATLKATNAEGIRFSKSKNDDKRRYGLEDNYDGKWKDGDYVYVGPKVEGQVEKEMLDYIMSNLNDKRFGHGATPWEAIGYVMNYISDMPQEVPNWTMEAAEKFTPEMFLSHDQLKTEKTLRSDSFKRWFGDWENSPKTASKVVDENGRPLPVYHGTREGVFFEFKDAKNGIFFTDSPAIADDYAFFDNDEDDPDAMVHEVYLNMRKPFVIDADYYDWKSLPESYNGLSSGSTTTDGWAKFLKSEYGSKYDGLIVKNVSDGYGRDEISTVYAVFSPKQIKSVDNNGDFDPDNLDIRFSKSVKRDQEYMEAVESGDMEAVQRMVNEAVKEALPDTKVVDENGNPLVVYHNGEFGKDGNTVANGLMHFGTIRAAEDRGNDPSRTGGDTKPYFLDIRKPIMTRDEVTTYGGNEWMLDAYGISEDLPIAQYQHEGHDGNEYINVVEDPGSKSWVAYSPNQIKSAEPIVRDDSGNVIPLSERFNPKDLDIRFSKDNRTNEMFISNAESALDRIKQEKATPEQWLKMLEKEGGLKAGEDKWIGLSDWLRSSNRKTLTRQEVADYIDQNRIRIEEVHYSEFGRMTDEQMTDFYEELPPAVDKFHSGLQEEFYDLMQDLDAGEAYDKMAEKYGEKFEEAYDREEAIDNESLQWNYIDPLLELAGFKNEGEDNDDRMINPTRLTYTMPGLKNKREIALTVPSIEPYNEHDEVHFGDAGPGRAIAWIRFGEMSYDEQMKASPEDKAELERLNQKVFYLFNKAGSEPSDENREAFLKARDERDAFAGRTHARELTERRRVLFIDEIQSKRHQEGREKGYKPNPGELSQKADEIAGIRERMDAKMGELEGVTNLGAWAEKDEEYKKLQAEMEKAGDEFRDLRKRQKEGVAMAPFEKNWHELAMKRMLLYAAENNFDEIAWTTGDQQAERYDLSDVVSKIISRPDEHPVSGEKEFDVEIYGNKANAPIYSFIVSKDGVVEAEEEEYDGKKLSDIIGKELANKILSSEDGTVIEGDNLRIGGEGMRGFYDRILPTFMNKYGKKWGVKVEDREIDSDSVYDEAGKPMTFHTVKITPDMKRSVKEGQLMFSKGPAASEVKDNSVFAENNRREEIFFSNAEAAVGRINQEKATPEQWLKMIEKEGGLKAGEDKWIGLSDWLKSLDRKTVTKQEIADYIAENKIQIEEQRYSEGNGLEEQIDRKYPGFSSAFGIDNTYEAGEIWLKDLHKARELYERVTGENADDLFESDLDDFAMELANEVRTDRAINGTRLNYTTRGLDNKREIALVVPTIEPWNQGDDIHFGDAGNGRAIAWVRFGETWTMPDEWIKASDALEELRKKYDNKMFNNPEMTKEDEELRDRSYNVMDNSIIKNSLRNKGNVLVIDEIQSKRHQEGRDIGYANPMSEEEKKARKEEYDKVAKGMTLKYGSGVMGQAEFWDEVNPLDKERILEVREKYREIEKSERGVRPAPFEKNWHELAMKRMLRLAAEEGYDYVAWTTGDQQAERYNLSDKIGNIYINKQPAAADLYMVKTFTPDGNIITGASGMMTTDRINEVFGKDLSSRMMKDADEKNGEDATISGDGLKIGGEGMKGFYDDMLPRFMNKYGKKWGVKVSDITLPGIQGEGHVMHAVPVTPEMRESVLGGQPMFSKGTGSMYSDPAFKEELRKGDIFVSNALQAVEGISMEKATPRQWLKMIEGKGGLKSGEDKWIGLSDWLNRSDKKTLTKQEVADFIARNAIKVEETSYGGPGESPINNTRLQYTTDGLENKREIALTVPTIVRWNDMDDVHFGDAGGGRAVAWIRFGDATISMDDKDVDKAERALGAFSSEMVAKYGVDDTMSKMSEEEIDRLATLVKETENLPRNVLFIDEIQSKRHQAGRENGYIYDENEAERIRWKLFHANKDIERYVPKLAAIYNFNPLSEPGDLIPQLREIAQKGGGNSKEIEEQLAELERLDRNKREAIEEYNSISGRVPAAPFEKNWQELAMKRMLRYAAENGYDYVAWTTGDQQAERYDLSKKINSIYRERAFDTGEVRYDLFPTDGTGSVSLFVKDGLVTRSRFDELAGKRLDEVVGKDIANKMLEMKDHESLDAQSLSVGGDGMKGFYDEMLPRFMNKYGKKWGVNESEKLVTLSDGSLLEAHTVPVNEEMKKSVMKGQLMFSKSRNDAIKNADESGLSGVIGKDEAGRVYRDAMRLVPEDVRREIIDRSMENGLDFGKATREYIGKLAEGGTENDETGLLRVLYDEIRSASGNPELTDADIRYMLWRDAQSSSGKDDVLALASEEAMKRRFGAGVPSVSFSMGKDFGEKMDTAREKIRGRVSAASDELKEDVKSGEIASILSAMRGQREYDRETVSSIVNYAKDILKGGNVDTMTRTELTKLLTLIGRTTGKSPEYVDKYADQMIDTILDNIVKKEKASLDKLIKIRDKKLDNSGVEVMGRLDKLGQITVAALRGYKDSDLDRIHERLDEVSEMITSPDDAVRENAWAEHTGLELAERYHNEVKLSEEEVDDLKREIREASASEMGRKAYREFIKETTDAIRENKIQRVESMQGIAAALGEGLAKSIESAREFRKAKEQRIEEIHHDANRDLQGTPTTEHRTDGRVDKILNSSFVRLMLSPLATFDQMLRQFGRHSVNGEGYLWNRYMRGWVDSTEKAFLGFEEQTKILDDKVSELFGKKMIWSDLYEIERKIDKEHEKKAGRPHTATFMDGGEMKSHELTSGNLLYIYMVNKMTDGRMKLRKMGITQEDVDRIKAELDPRFIQLADWVQDEYLVSTRNRYNAVHEQLFGAPMAAVQNYFPLKINKMARVESVEPGGLNYGDNALPSTTTGAIIKRRTNSLALDVTKADAFSVVIEHLQQMEDWAAFAPLREDMKSLLSYKSFRNKVLNMKTVYGSGETLWNNFRNVVDLASGVYKPKINRDSVDAVAVNVAKGVTGAKIAFRVQTALKQMLSAPAFLSDAKISDLAKNLFKPVSSWNWCYENLPVFRKRWKSRIAGDTRLEKTDSDWESWSNAVVENLSRWGMTPNAFVDAMTVAVGAKSMYESKLRKYKELGLSDESAERKAKQDATILYNQTQQSNEGAFVSAMQKDRTFLSTTLSTFRNSSMGYTRQTVDALRNYARMGSSSKTSLVEFATRQRMNEGADEEKARSTSEKEYNRERTRNAARIGIFAFLLPMLWNFGVGPLLYLVFGNNKKRKEKIVKDSMLHTLAGPIEGLAGGNIVSTAWSIASSGGKFSNSSSLGSLPAISDAKTVLQTSQSDPTRALNQIIELVVQTKFGVNPQTVTDVVEAILDASKGDLGTAKEIALLMMRITQFPQSAIEDFYFDEIEMSAKQAMGATPEELAQRYAEYKVRRNAPLTGWSYSEEQREKKVKNQMKTINKKLKERKETE